MSGRKLSSPASILGFLVFTACCPISASTSYSGSTSVTFADGQPGCAKTAPASTTPTSASTGCDEFSLAVLGTAHGDASATASNGTASTRSIIVGGQVHAIADQGLGVTTSAAAFASDGFTWTNPNVIGWEASGVIHSLQSGSNFTNMTSSLSVRIDNFGTLGNNTESCIAELQGVTGVGTSVTDCGTVTPVTVAPGDHLVITLDLNLALSGKGPFNGSIDATSTGFIDMLTALDAHGNIVTDPGLISDSGIKYNINQGGTTPTPEPGSLGLFATALVGLAVKVRFRRR